MEAEWFILIEGQKEGPFTLAELKRHPRLNPDRLVWKRGFKDWKPAGKIKELKEIFKDQTPKKIEKPDFKKIKGSVVTLDTRHLHPGPFLWVLFLIILTLLYTIYRLYF